MNSIPEAFLRHASAVLADTDNGLTSGQIARYFLSKSVQENVDIPYPTPTLKDTNDNFVTKKEVFYQNLSRFPPKSQYQIIIEICESHIKVGFGELKILTMQRYGEAFGSASQSVNQSAQAPAKTPVIAKTPSTSTQLNIPTMPVFPAPPLPPKPWYTKPKYFVPLLAAFIIGLFTLWSALIKEEKPAPGTTSVNDKTYELTLIDHKTFKTPIFKIPNPKIRIYHTSPPTVITVVDGTAQFKSDPASLDNPVLIEFENVTNYSFVDRKQTLKPGKNDVLVVSKTK